MIYNTTTMKMAEDAANTSAQQLIQQAALKCNETIIKYLNKDYKTLIVAGPGKNGSDGIFIMLDLLKRGYNANIYFIKDNEYANLIKEEYTITKTSLFTKYDVIIDCVFGSNFHSPLDEKTTKLFNTINNTKAFKISIDINSGIEADSAITDLFIKSNLTLVIEALKPCHLFNKELNFTNELKVIKLDLPKQESNFITIDHKTYLKLLPTKEHDIYKNQNGQALIVAGSKGYSGACIMNIEACQKTGNGYNHVLLDDDIYHIVASKCISPVYHFTYDTNIHHIINNVDSICFGSGANNMYNGKYIFDILLQNATCPLIWDGQAFNFIKDNLYLLQFSKSDIIMTPHLGEFARLLNLPIEEVKKNKFELAKQFSKRYKLILCLKGVNTIVCSYDGRIYINQTGNNVLAKAGSGDILTGLITGYTTQIKDSFIATCLAVYEHGQLADEAIKHKSYYSIQPLDIIEYKDFIL